LGDLLAAYDARERRGLTLGFLDASPTGNHGNDRELLVVLDAGTAPAWTDLGRPSEATIMVAGLAVLDGALYAATWEGPPSNRGQRLSTRGGSLAGLRLALGLQRGQRSPSMTASSTRPSHG
jgi:hypothetical protein